MGGLLVCRDGGDWSRLIFKMGDKIQEVVDEKNNVTDIRAATIIDLLYAIILFYFRPTAKYQ